MRVKPIIMQHCFFMDRPGGPATGLRVLLKSRLAEKYDFPVVSQERPAGGLNLGLVGEMAAQIRAVSPDVLHVRGLQNEGLHGLLAGRLARVRRIVVSAHGFAGDMVGSSRLRSFLFSHALEPLTLRNADATYCVCGYAAARPIIRRHAHNFQGVIYNVVIPPGPDAHTLRREEFGFTPEDVVLVSVSRVTVDKGLFVLAEVMQQLAAQGRNTIKLLLVGDGEGLPALQTMLAPLIANGQVVCTGARKDVWALHGVSDVFVFPTFYENLSNALLEAMASSLPVIATAVGGNPEVVLDGVSGLLIPPRDADALLQAILTLADDATLRRACGERGLAHVRDAFSLTRLEESLDRVYTSLLQA